MYYVSEWNVSFDLTDFEFELKLTYFLFYSYSRNVHFIDKDGQETYVTVNDYPDSLQKKMKLLTYFKRYMMEHLVKAGEHAVVSVGDSLSRIPHLHTWFRTTCAVVMHLTNGTVQLNFTDHGKIILCPHMSAVSYMDNERNFRTFKFSTIAQYGCSTELYQRLRYAHEKLKKLMEN